MQQRRQTAHSQMTQPIRVRPLPPGTQAAMRTAVKPAPRPVQGKQPHSQAGRAALPQRRQAAAPRNRQPAARVSYAPGIPQPVNGHLPARPAFPAKAERRSLRPLWWIAGIGLFLTLLTCAALTLGMGLIYAGGILPGVRTAGVALGGLSQTQAADRLRAEWTTITARDEQRGWQIDPAALGITLDAEATARAAYEAGRTNLGGLIPGILGRLEVAPVVNINTAQAEASLREYAAQFELLPTNAGIRLVNGQVETTPPVNGRALDSGATLANLTPKALADGIIELAMNPIAPSVTDATPMLEAARRLLGSYLDLRVYDPITGDSVYWSAPPETWGNWLTATTAANGGLALTANAAPVKDYLQAQMGVLDSGRYLKLDEAVNAVQNSIRAGSTTPTIRVYHRDRQHVVRAGETIISIAWDYGVPYLYIVQANGGLENVSIGQTITIPSPDNFLPYEVVPDKRIVVSISQQRAWVYENGGLKWEWVVSTGIADSPTWPGIYQIISHEPNAYAGNWDLWMPQFMGVYQPIPGASFTNGFHGFPTRGGSQLLWTNSLGTRVTYGCILLSNDNVNLLYNWAQEGVVVEIRA